MSSEYPDELANEILCLSGIVSKERILDIGCGPGNATILFARKGYSILGGELGEHLAALAIEKCRSYPRVRTLHMAFEDWKPEERGFEMAQAADSFHWIPPEIGYPGVARALKKTGSLGFFWRVPVDPGTDWSREINSPYQEIAPQCINPDKGLPLNG